MPRVLGVPLVLAVGAIAFAGCGSSGGGAPSGGLDCAWLAGNNCWKATTELAAACLPPPTETGVLNAGDTTCSYPSGAMVTFNVPLMTSSVQQPSYDFAVTGPGGQACLTFKSMSNGGFTVSVQGQAVTLAATQTGFTLTCPDGSKVGGHLADLVSCTDASLSSLVPSYGLLSAQSTTFSLTGTPDPSTELTVFSCAAGNGNTTPRYNDCAITGGTDPFPPNLCVDYTGSANTGFDGGGVAMPACDALYAVCGNACERIYALQGNCTTTNAGLNLVASCIVNQGQPLEETIRFYPPTTFEQGQAYCVGRGGVYVPIV